MAMLAGCRPDHAKRMAILSWSWRTVTERDDKGYAVGSKPPHRRGRVIKFS